MLITSLISYTWKVQWAHKFNNLNFCGEFLCLILPVRSMFVFLLASISVKSSWKWSLTAARTALWAKNDCPVVCRVMSQKSPASLWLLSLLSISAPCDAMVFMTHLLPLNSWEAKTNKKGIAAEGNVTCDWSGRSASKKNYGKWEWAKMCENKNVWDAEKLSAGKNPEEMKRLARRKWPQWSSISRIFSHLWLFTTLTLTFWTAEDKVSDLEVHSCGRGRKKKQSQKP